MGLIDQEKARIFRITHIDNIEWAIRHGLHCRNSATKDPNFKEIGNPEIISKRASRIVPFPPGGSLDDYIPFYFTPFSPMLLNIKTGHHGLRRFPMEEIVILVASLPELSAKGHSWIFSDRHALMDYAEFHDDLDSLSCLDWAGLKARDFSRDPEKPDKLERYQAEALIHKHLPLNGLSGMVCHGPKQEEKLKLLLEAGDMWLPIAAKPDWYFR